MKVLALTLVLATGLLCGCATTAMNDADTFIRAESPKFADAVSRFDWNTVAAYYTDDAVVLAPNADIARGPAAIRATFASFESMRPRLTISTDRVEQSGDLAYEYGTYEMQLTPQGASRMTDRGKYLTVWRRTASGWKIAADMFNTSLPAPGH